MVRVVWIKGIERIKKGIVSRGGSYKTKLRDKLQIEGVDLRNEVPLPWNSIKTREKIRTTSSIGPYIIRELLINNSLTEFTY